jgi:hypothetical protein
VKTGVAYRSRETLNIGPKTTTLRGSRYISLEDLERQAGTGQILVLSKKHDQHGS